MQRRAQSCVDRPCYLWRTFSPLQLAAHSAFQGCVCRCGFHVLRRGSRLKPVSVGYPSQIRQLGLELFCCSYEEILQSHNNLSRQPALGLRSLFLAYQLRYGQCVLPRLSVTTVRRILMSRNLPRQNRQGRLVAETIVRYRTVDVGGKQDFLSRSGQEDAPTLLLLHGFPTASHMFWDLIPLLADRFRLVAPDLPGFGQSDMPSRQQISPKE